MNYDPYIINKILEAIQSIQQNIGVTPGGVYSDARVRLDVLEARINNPLVPYPTVDNPFIIGNSGISISTGSGPPTENLLDGSLYLRQDGSSEQGLYARRNGAWVRIGIQSAAGSWIASGDLAGDDLSQLVIGLYGRPLASDSPEEGDALIWDGNKWKPSSEGVGLQGSQGYQGSQGVQGYQGPIGVQGYQGDLGLQGEQGLQGNTGVQGSLGPQGYQGSPGDNKIIFNAQLEPGVVLLDLVCVSGSALNAIKVDKASADDETKMPAIGILVNKDNDTEGYVASTAVVEIPGLIPGSIYFAGPSGTITNTTPAPVSSSVFVQQIGIALTQNLLLLNLSTNYMERIYEA